jgi:ribose 5-phosphate isomerase B
MTPQKIYLGADHAGWERKEKIKEWLELPFEDLSNPELNPADDYPDVAFRVAERVADEPESVGILLCGSGLGMCMAANKVKGIRAVAVYNEWAARASREDNDANVLCLPGRVLEDDEIKSIVTTWLSTNFSSEERHVRRIVKLDRGGLN